MKGLGPMQITQMFAARKQALKNEIKKLDDLENMMNEVYGAPQEGNGKEQDKEILSDYVANRWFSDGNIESLDDVQKKFTANPNIHISNLSCYMTRAPRKHEIMREIERQYNNSSE